MSFLNKLFSRRSSKISDYPEFKSCFSKIQNLLKKSILEFSTLKNLINCLSERVLKLKNEDDQRNLFDIIRKHVKYLFQDVYNKLKQEKRLEYYYQLVNTMTFLFTFALNFPNKVLIEMLFENNCNLMDCFLKCVKLSSTYSDQHEIAKILTNFFGMEYVVLFTDLGLKDTYVSLKDKFMKVVLDNSVFTKYSYKEYKILMKNILIQEFDYKKIFESQNLCGEEDKVLCKFF